MPHSPSRLVTQEMPVDLVRGAEAVEFLAYLERVLPDEAVRRHVQKGLGQALYGEMKDRFLLNLVGPPASGKSVLLAVLEKVFGGYGTFVPASALQEDPGRSGSAASPTVELMRRKKLVLSSEPDDARRYNASFVKQLTGGDKIYSRGLYRGGGPWMPRMTVVVATNSFIKFNVSDEALSLRIHPVEFPRQFRFPDGTRPGSGPEGGETWADIPEEERADLGLRERICSSERELSGVLWWLLEGFRMYLEEGLEVPRGVAEHRVLMRRTVSGPVDWLWEQLETGRVVRSEPLPRIGQGGVTRTIPKRYCLGIREAFLDYERWCAAEGAEPLGLHAFRAALAGEGLERPDRRPPRRGGVWAPGASEADNGAVFDLLAWCDWQTRWGV
jgi:putative DNA primase/helicase